MKNLKWIYRFLLLVLGVYAIVYQVIRYGSGMLLYYTILSNVAAAVLLGFMLVAKYRHQESVLEETRFLRIKGGVSVAIFVTFAIYHLMLRPYLMPDAIWTVDNLVVHYIVPLGLNLDTLLWDRRGTYSKWQPFLWLSGPLAYSLLALFNGYITRWEIPGTPDSPFAYPFLDIPKYGLASVALSTLVMFLGFLVLGYIFTGLKALVGPRSSDKY